MAGTDGLYTFCIPLYVQILEYAFEQEIQDMPKFYIMYCIRLFLFGS